MKKITFSAVLLCMLAISGYAQSPAPAMATITFLETSKSHDFGVIPQGSPATYSFAFKNTGTAPLVITNVVSSCGCVYPTWIKTPVAPGALGYVSGTHNTVSAGAFTKSLTVITNATNAATILYLKGEIKPSEPQPK